MYFCCEQRRREAVRADLALNGIDFLEVLDQDAPADSPPQQTLLVRLLKPVPALAPDHVLIAGGERITPVRVVWVAPASAPPATTTALEKAFFTALPAADHVLLVRTDSSGDFSIYTLRLVTSPIDLNPPAGFDRLLASVDFSFKVECPAEFDCRPVRICPEPAPDEPVINYLAKDYGSFRRLMLDRMAQLMPDWQPRSPADLGIALVELLAYAGDHLSYQQDGIATEAYLATARRRVSVRRHARLVDYHMHNGCNARAWVQIRVDRDSVALDAHTPILTRVLGQGPRIALTATPSEYEKALRQQPVVFETLHASTLFEAHNELFFYGWGDRECCLPTGATRATLRGHLPNLKGHGEGHGEVGDVLVLEEALGPHTGRPEDADPARRHALRLVEVIHSDEDGNPLTDRLTGQRITEIRWHPDDALPFAFCISARTDDQHGNAFVDDVSLARGNLVLADHGRTLADEELGQVPEPHLFLVGEAAADRCAPPRRAVPPRFRPKLKEAPLTHAAPFEPKAPPESARAAMTWRLEEVVPWIALHELPGPHPEGWRPRSDLLASDASARHFVAEVENDGAASIRFGDDRHGMRPQSGTAFSASYRIGNGRAGNVGAEALAHVVTDAGGIVDVRNPLSARHGVDPETIEEVRQRAPFAFRTQERAVTPVDYGEVSERHPGVQRAAATFRWTGSWHTAFVTVDRIGGLRVDPGFEDDIRRHLEVFRMAGYDLEVDEPRLVSLEIEIQICVEPGHFRSDVKAALLEVLSNRDLPDGHRGVFHPDNFTFGEPVYLSPIYAAAQRVAGVQSAYITTFQRQGVPDPRPRELGRLDLGRLEIARLDNDPDFPERGVLRLQVLGGK